MIKSLCIASKVSNTYGCPYVFEQDGRFFFGVGDHVWGSDGMKEISVDFFRAFLAEFEDIPVLSVDDESSEIMEYLQGEYGEEAIEKALTVT